MSLEKELKKYYPAVVINTVMKKIKEIEKKLKCLPVDVRTEQEYAFIFLIDENHPKLPVALRNFLTLLEQKVKEYEEEEKPEDLLEGYVMPDIEKNRLKIEKLKPEPAKKHPDKLQQSQEKIKQYRRTPYAQIKIPLELARKIKNRAKKQGLSSQILSVVLLDMALDENPNTIHEKYVDVVLKYGSKLQFQYKKTEIEKPKSLL